MSEQRLHPRAVTLWRLTAVIRGLFLFGLTLGAEWWLGTPFPLGVPAAAVGVVVLLHLWVLPPLQFAAWRYDLGESDLYLRHGVLFRTTSIVPHARIQHVDTQHGPLDRWLGLAALVVYTAGTRGAIISIPALGRDQAETLRDRLAALSGAGDAV